MPTPTLVHTILGPPGSGGGSLTDYFLPYPGAKGTGNLAGNLLVVWITTNTPDPTPAIAGFTAGPKVVGNQTVAMFYRENVAAGTYTGAAPLHITFTSATNAVQVGVAEFANVATATSVDGGTSSTGSGTGTAVSSAAITTTVDGDLVIQVGWQDSGSTTTTSFTPGASWTRLVSDISQSNLIIGAAFAQYIVQSTHGSITPSFTMAPSAHFDTAAIAFKAASAGTIPTGMLIRHIFHAQIPGSSASPLSITFPTTGNLIVAATIFIPACNVTAITDSKSNTWSFAGASFGNSGSGNLRFGYAANATPDTAMIITVTFTGTNTSGDTIVFYDIEGANTSPFDSTAGNPTASGTDAGTGSHTISTASITPSTADGFCFSMIGVTNPAPINAVSPGQLVSATSTPETSSGDMDENNGWGVEANSTTSARTYVYTDPISSAGQWAAMAVHFKAPVTLTVVVDSPEQALPGVVSTTSPFDLIDAANYEFQDVGILPTPPRSQQFEEGDTSRNFDWRYSQHEEDTSSRAPNPPTSEQFEEGEISRSFDWSVRVDDSTEASKTPPAPVFAQEELEQPNRSLDSWMRMDDSTETSRVPAPPFSELEEYDLSFWRDYRVVVDEGWESQKLPVVVVVTPTAADETFEARSYDVRSVFDDSTESSIAPPAPVSFQDDGDSHRSTDYRVIVDDSTESSALPLAAIPVSPEDLIDAARSFDRVFGFQDDDYSQKTPPVIIVPTTAADDTDSIFAGLQTSAIVTDQDWTNTAPLPPGASQDHELVQPWGSLQAFWIEDEASGKTPPPPPIILTAADGDQLFFDVTGYGRFAAAFEEMAGQFVAGGGPFVLFAVLRHRTYSQLIASHQTYSQLEATHQTYSQLIASGGHNVLETN